MPILEVAQTRNIDNGQACTVFRIPTVEME